MPDGSPVVTRARQHACAVRISISLSLLLVASLALQICLPAESRLFSGLPTGKIYNLPAPKSSPNTEPLPGELLVRFIPPLSEKLHAAMMQSRKQFGLFAPDETQLIGARMPKDLLLETLPELNKFAQRYGLWAADAINFELGMWRLKISPQIKPLSAVQELNQTKGIIYAEANYSIQAFTREPNDPFFSGNQYGLRAIEAPLAWDISTGSNQVTIAVLDTGLAYGHSDLRNKIVAGRGRNFVAEPANEFAWDDNGHGSYVAGIAAAQTNNNNGMSGVAWNARLMAVKVLDYNFQGSIATLAMGISYAASQSVQIINMSTGGPVRSRLLEEMTQRAFDQGIVLVAAAGNGGKEELNYPAAFDTVIAVGASDELDRPATFSSYGNYISLLAPGVDILSLYWATDVDYARTSGTSAACPFVAGTVALMLSINPNLTTRQVRAILEGTADPLAAPVAQPSATPAANTTAQTTLATATPSPSPVLVTAPAKIPSPTPGAISASSFGVVYTPQTGWGRLNAAKAVEAAQKSNIPISRYASLTGVIKGIPNPEDVTVSLEKYDTRYPGFNGRYEFNLLVPGTYQLLVESKKYGISSEYEFTIQGRGGEVVQKDFDLTFELNRALNNKTLVGAFQRIPPPPNAEADSIYFSQTGHTLAGTFKQFWEKQGGLPIFGYPISEEFQEKGLTVQYFERAVFEYHSEFARTRSEVQLRLLGNLAAQGRTEPAFSPIFELSKTPPNTATVRYFDVTGHSLSNQFRQFWEKNGGVDIFGYPISEPFNITENGKARRVQYFQRARMDYYPDQENTPFAIQLALLGHEAARADGLVR